MRKSDIKVGRKQKVEVQWPTPPDYFLIPSRFTQYRVSFAGPDHEVDIMLFTDRNWPPTIGPYKLAWNEMGGVRYEIADDKSE